MIHRYIIFSKNRKVKGDNFFIKMTLFVFIIIDMCKLVLIRTSCDAMVLVDCHSLSFSVLFMINLFKYGSRKYIFYHYLLSLNYLRPTCLTCQRYENLGLHDLNDVSTESEDCRYRVLKVLRCCDHWDLRCWFQSRSLWRLWLRQKSTVVVTTPGQSRDGAWRVYWNKSKIRLGRNKFSTFQMKFYCIVICFTVCLRIRKS